MTWGGDSNRSPDAAWFRSIWKDAARRAAYLKRVRRARLVHAHGDVVHTRGTACRR